MFEFRELLEGIVLVLILVEVSMLIHHARIEHRVDEHLLKLDEHLCRLDERLRQIENTSSIDKDPATTSAGTEKKS